MDIPFGSCVQHTLELMAKAHRDRHTNNNIIIIATKQKRRSNKYAKVKQDIERDDDYQRF